MRIKISKLAAALSAAIAVGFSGNALAQSDGVIKIGVMNDMSGLYADIAGPG